MQWQRALKSPCDSLQTPPLARRQASSSSVPWFLSRIPSSNAVSSGAAVTPNSERPDGGTPARSGHLNGDSSRSTRAPTQLSRCTFVRSPCSCDESVERLESGYENSDDAAAAAALSVDEEQDIEDEEDWNELAHSKDVHKMKGRRLWDDRVVYPAGVQRWDNSANCMAALEFACPCNAGNCLSRVGDVLKLYKHRRKLRVAVGKRSRSGALRDTLSEQLRQHYDAELGAFSQSFTVGGVGGICERAFAVAAGVSEATFVRARADVTRTRPNHQGRVKIKAKTVTFARAQLDAWVRAQRNTMEGDKTSGMKWYTEKVTERQLWLRYTKGCDKAQVTLHKNAARCVVMTPCGMCSCWLQVPTVGSSRLLFDVWKSHEEIIVVKPTGHAICDTCSEIHAERLALEGLDPARLAELDEEAELHHQFHAKEREYYDNAVLTATHHPELVTCLTIDAPTQHQFDLPCQPRWKRDVSKKLDGTNRWQSKVEAVLDAGVGMMVYVARIGLGGGANLVSTVLYLSLMMHVQLGRPLGHRLHLQIDNTTAENKNNTLIGAVGLLVAWGVFTEAVIFFMPVGHTYNELDAAFSPLITSLVKVAVATVSALLLFIREALAGKRVRECCQLHHLWDFDMLMSQHMHALGGFARTQQSSGMHEFHLSLDKDGAVRLRARQSSQASTWLPEGDGEVLFSSLPCRDDPPPVAAPTKTATGWRCTEVQTNVRRWLPYVGLTCSALNEAEKEWEHQFQLAVDDVTRLPADKCLVWQPLPTAPPTLRRSALTTVSSRRDIIENPPVNPLHGAIRRSSQVQAELLEYQQHQRLIALEHNWDPPMYLGEYIFMWVPNGGAAAERSLVLARICAVPPGGAITSSAVVDVVEYTHTPESDFDGFFGVFRPRKNPAYDAKAKGSLAFIRHRDVPRVSIVICNVHTFGPASELRVSAASLRHLSDALPEKHQMPDLLPDAHERHSAGEGVRVGRSSNARSTTSAAPSRPVLPNGTWIEVNWTEDPVGWFKGKVTSSRREGERWVTRVLYSKCNEWPTHSAWHYLDPADNDAVEWRVTNADPNDNSSDSSDSSK